MKTRLQKMIEDRTARVVVLGLGYVGLPVACLFAEAGFPVCGIRRSQDKVDMINGRQCPIEGKEPGLVELLRQVVSNGRFRAGTEYSACRDAQVVLIAVETPVDPVTKKPGYKASHTSSMHPSSTPAPGPSLLGLRRLPGLLLKCFQLLDFVGCQVAPLSRLQRTQLQRTQADALQFQDRMAQ